MERSRAWPWKKKIADKLASAALEFKQGNEQLDACIDLGDQAPGMTPLQQAEAKIKILTEQLVAKDEVVLQHARVAEEAVSGWEKAELETANVRELLGAESQKRLATEDRVAHLDGALKECMKQLRHVREQQEQKIQEAILKKTREWEEVRGEMETKMTELANGLLEAEAEKAAMTKSLQERAKAIKEAKEGRSNAEEKVKLLQVKLETSDKDHAKWKYELHVLSKELQIRNEELEYNKKATEVANKQHLENVKKVAKLEAECQRLRLLVRKKLPGPAAISQMKMEVEALGIAPSMPIERGRRAPPSCRSKSNNWKPERGETPWITNDDVDEEQILAMEAENKALKEALSKSNSELQTARMLYAHTASKLSSAEEQLENASTISSYQGLSGEKQSPLHGFIHLEVGERSQEHSVASVLEDGALGNESICAESWATNQISELSPFHKEKGGSIPSPLLDPSCDLMDDFAEMEKLASMPLDDRSSPEGEPAGKKHLGDAGDKLSLYVGLSASDAKMQSICKACQDLQRKLSGAEDELNVVRLQRLSARAALSSIEKQLVAILQSGECASLTDALEEVRAALNEPRCMESKSSLDMTACSERVCMEIESAEVRDTRMWSPSDLSSCQSEESTSKQELPLTTIKVNTVSREVVTAMHKVACLVDSLSQVDFDMLTSETHPEGERNDSLGQGDALKQWRSSELTSCVQSLITLCNGALHSEVDMMDFLVEITSALDWLVSHLFSMPSMLHETGSSGRRLGLDKGSVSPHESQRVDMVIGPPTSVCKIDYSNGTAADTLPTRSGGFSGNEQDSYSRSFGAHRQTPNLVEQLNQLRAEKDEGDEKLKLLTLELEDLKSQMEESRLNTSHLESTLKSVLDSKASLMADVAGLVSAKGSIESELREAKEEMKKLEERAQSLEVQLQDETQCRKDIEAMYQDLLGRRSYSTAEKRQVGMTSDETSMGDTSRDEMAAKSRKEQEIAAAAEKLAVCQQTILALGKQLKDLGLPTAGGDASPALKLPSHRSPMSEHKSHSMCDQLPSVYGRGLDSASTSPIGFPWQVGEDSGSFSDERTRTTSSLHGSLRSQNDGRHGGLSYGGYTDASHVRTSCEALLSPDRSQVHTRGTSFVSPDYYELPSSRCMATVPAKDLALTSPGRSPARFLNIKWRGGDANKPDDGLSSLEKHGTGFTRFFSRKKGSR